MLIEMLKNVIEPCFR